MSNEFGYKLSFNIEGSDAIKKAVERLESVGVSVDKVEKQFKQIKKYNSETKKFEVIGQKEIARISAFADNTYRLGQAIRELGGKKALGDRELNFKQIATRLKSRRQELKEQEAEEKRLAKLRYDNAGQTLHIASLEEKWEKAVDARFSKQEKQEAADLRRKEAAAKKVFKIKQKNYDDAYVTYEKMGHKMRQIDEKIEKSQKDVASKSYMRQKEVEKGIDLVRAAYDKASQHFEAYKDAVIAGDKKMMIVHKWTAEQYISKANSMAAATVTLANKQEKLVAVNDRIRRSSRSAGNAMEELLKKTNKMHHTMLSLNRLGHMAGLAGAFYLAERAARGYAEAVHKSLEFNDQLTKSQIIFQGLALSQTAKSAHQISLYGSAQEKADLEKAHKVGEILTEDIRQLAIRTGQSFADSMAVGKSALAHIQNKYKGPGNMLMNDLGGTREHLKDVLELSALLKMIDGQNRQLSLHAREVTHVFYGREEGSDSIKRNFQGLLRVEGIRVGAEFQKGIEDAIDKGDYRGAMKKFQEALRGSGLYQGKIEDLMINSIHNNVEAVKSSLAVMFAQFNRPLYVMFAEWVGKLNSFFGGLSNNKKFMGFLKQAGVEQAAFAQKIVGTFIRMAHFFETDKGQKFFADARKLFTDVLNIAVEIGRVVGSFLGGFFDFQGVMDKNGKSTKTWHDALVSVKDIIHNMNSPASALGRLLRTIADSFAAVISKIGEYEQKYGWIGRIVENTGNVIEWTTGFNEWDKQNHENAWAEQQGRDMEAKLKRMKKQRQLEKDAPFASIADSRKAGGSINISDASIKKFVEKMKPATPSIVIQSMTVQSNDGKKFAEDLGKVPQLSNPFGLGVGSHIGF